MPEPAERRRPRTPAGHAIEVRLYAEDPAADYQPQSGTLTTFEIPHEPGIRVDAGFESGSEVSTHYDAMLAKVICHAPSRAAAARQLAGVLVPGPDPRRPHQPRPAGRDPARPGVPRRRGDAPRSCDSPGFEARSRTRAANLRRGAAVAAALALAETDRARPHRPAGHPGRLAQRHEPAAAHRVRGRRRRRVVGRARRLPVDGPRRGRGRRDRAWCSRPTACGRHTTWSPGDRTV